MPAHRWLLGLQAASAVALVVVAALLSVSAGARARDANVESGRVALLRLRPALMEYPPAQAQRYVRSVVDKLEALPGVESVSMVGSGIALMGFVAEVATDSSEAEAPTSQAGFLEIGPRYFETLGTPVLRGREFTISDDSTSSRVAVVSTQLARQMWPEKDPIGETIRVNDTEHVVVGLTADVLLQPRGESPRPYVFVPYWQNPEHVDARLQVRVSGDPAVMLPALVCEAQKVDPQVPVAETITLDWRLAGMFRPLWMSATAVTYAGGLAVILSALGLYASLAAAVARRTKEIGIRRAIGASSSGILAMVTREGMRVILTGVLTGAALALMSTHLLRHMLYGTASGDAIYYVLAAALVAIVGLLACLVPARRAARIEPMQALRTD